MKENNTSMKNKNNNEMLTEYDFSNGVRGKFAKQFKAGSNIVILEPDVAKIYHDSKTVNATLRAAAKIAALAK